MNAKLMTYDHSISLSDCFDFIYLPFTRSPIWSAAKVDKRPWMVQITRSSASRVVIWRLLSRSPFWIPIAPARKARDKPLDTMYDTDRLSATSFPYNFVCPIRVVFLGRDLLVVILGASCKVLPIETLSWSSFRNRKCCKLVVTSVSR